jgi:hypothetical protein
MEVRDELHALAILPPDTNWIRCWVGPRAGLNEMVSLPLMEPEISSPFSQEPASSEDQFNVLLRMCFFLWWTVVSPPPNQQARGPPLVGSPRLLIQYIRSYPPNGRQLLLFSNWRLGVRIYRKNTWIIREGFRTMKYVKNSLSITSVRRSYSQDLCKHPFLGVSKD